MLNLIKAQSSLWVDACRQPWHLTSFITCLRSGSGPHAFLQMGQLLTEGQFPPLSTKFMCFQSFEKLLKVTAAPPKGKSGLPDCAGLQAPCSELQQWNSETPPFSCLYRRVCWSLTSNCTISMKSKKGHFG